MSEESIIHLVISALVAAFCALIVHVLVGDTK